MFVTSIKDCLALCKIFTNHSSPLSMNATCIYLLFYISSIGVNTCTWSHKDECLSPTTIPKPTSIPWNFNKQTHQFNLKNLIHYLRLYVDKKKKEKSKQTNASNPWKQQLLLFVKIPPHISTSLQKISVHIAPLFNYLLYGCKSLTCPARSFSSYDRYPCRLALHCLLHNFLWTRNIDSPSMSLCIPVEV